MSFNNLGNFTLAPGASCWIGYYFLDSTVNSGARGDHGAQYCMPDPFYASVDAWLNDTGVAWLYAEGQGKELTDLHQIVYAVHIMNYGPNEGHFSLHGGGLS